MRTYINKCGKRSILLYEIASYYTCKSYDRVLYFCAIILVSLLIIRIIRIKIKKGGKVMDTKARIYINKYMRMFVCFCAALFLMLWTPRITAWADGGS